MEPKKDYSEYHKEYYGNKKVTKKRLVVGIVGGLLLISFLFIFLKGGIITGNTINAMNQSNAIEIKTSFYIPELTLEDEYKKIELSLDRGTIIKLDNKKITLEDIKNKIILKDFEGKIKINEDKIKELNGEVSEIRINNLPINLEENGKLKVSLYKGSGYSFLKIKEDVNLKELFFKTSGTIKVGGDSLNLNSEEIQIKNYIGELKIENRKLILEGLVEEINIDSSSRSLSLSK